MEYFDISIANNFHDTFKSNKCLKVSNWKSFEENLTAHKM